MAANFSRNVQPYYCIRHRDKTSYYSTLQPDNISSNGFQAVLYLIQSLGSSDSEHQVFTDCSMQSIL